ncbi:MAG: hypothetical protein R3C01_00785 [Planctomycetaceae bacterium]
MQHVPEPQPTIKTATSRRNSLEIRLSRLRVLLEATLVFLVFEAMLRRLVPYYNSHIQAVKFIVIPLLTLNYWPEVIQGFKRAGVVAFLAFWIVSGFTITLLNVLDYSECRALGVLINLLCIPVLGLASSAYAEYSTRVDFLRRFSWLCGAVGLIAIIQSRLSPDHWSNVSMDFESSAIAVELGFRVTSVFSHCNVFGSFVAIGALACLAAFMTSQTAMTRFSSGASLLLILGGGMLSGSRMGALVPPAVCLAACISNKRIMAKLFLPVLATSVFVGTMWLVFSDANGIANMEFDGRAFWTEEAFRRVFDMYLGDDMRNAFDEGGGLGTGWGTRTMGVRSLANAAGFDAPVEVVHIESGFAIILAQGGIVGVLAFAVMATGILVHTIRRWPPLGWTTIGLVTYLLLGHLPLSLLELPVLATPFWMMLGVTMTTSNRRVSLEQQRLSRPLIKPEETRLARAA